MTTRKGIALPTGLGDTRGDAIWIRGFVADGTVKPRDCVLLSSDEKTLNQATAGSAWIGVVGYDPDQNWGTTTPSEDTAYPTTCTDLPVCVEGCVKARLDATYMAENSQMGVQLQPVGSGLMGRYELVGAATCSRRATLMDHLGGTSTDQFAEVKI